MRILFTGDIHIGRRSSRVPDALDGKRFSCAAVWEAMVELAIGRGVDLVLLSGDVADQANIWEALGPLRRGLRRLGEAGITTIAVAGNHDYEALAKLADLLDEKTFHLLGRGGCWERHTVLRDGRAVLHVDGWSFPGRYVDVSCVGELPGVPAPEGPGLGGLEGAARVVLLHGDLDQPDSRYGPLRRSELNRPDVAAWLLGHVHAPLHEHEPGRPVLLYPGSPQAMDPGETGAHGPWLVTIAAGGAVSCEQMPLSSVRYESVEVSLEDAADEQAFHRATLEAIGRARQACEASGGASSEAGRGAAPVLLSLRMTFTGRTALHGDMPRLLHELREGDAGGGGGGELIVHIDKAVAATRPAIDLRAVAAGRDAAAPLARLVLTLRGETAAADEADEGANEELSELLRAARQRVQAAHEHSSAALLGDAMPDDDAVRQCVLAQADRLLAALMDQRQPA